MFLVVVVCFVGSFPDPTPMIRVGENFIQFRGYRFRLPDGTRRSWELNVRWDNDILRTTGMMCLVGPSGSICMEDDCEGAGIHLIFTCVTINRTSKRIEFCESGYELAKVSDEDMAWLKEIEGFERVLRYTGKVSKVSINRVVVDELDEWVETRTKGVHCIGHEIMIDGKLYRMPKDAKKCYVSCHAGGGHCFNVINADNFIRICVRADNSQITEAEGSWPLQDVIVLARGVQDTLGSFGIINGYTEDKGKVYNGEWKVEVDYPKYGCFADAPFIRWIEWE